MNTTRSVLVPAIDILFLLIMTLLLIVFAIQYSEKGIGEKSFLEIRYVIPNTEAFLKKFNPPFVAIILFGENFIEMWEVIDPKKHVEIGTYHDLDEFALMLNKDQRYVIYELKESNLLTGVLRKLFDAGVSSIQIAKLEKYSSR